MLAYMEDGDAAEVGLIGSEGMVGLPVLLGADNNDIESMVQNPGTALRKHGDRAPSTGIASTTRKAATS
jgi:hypothetical protein